MTTPNVPRLTANLSIHLDDPLAPKILTTQMHATLQNRSPPRRELEVMLETSRGELESSNLEA